MTSIVSSSLLTKNGDDPASEVSESVSFSISWGSSSDGEPDRMVFSDTEVIVATSESGKYSYAATGWQ